MSYTLGKLKTPIIDTTDLQTKINTLQNIIDTFQNRVDTLTTTINTSSTELASKSSQATTKRNTIATTSLPDVEAIFDELTIGSMLFFIYSSSSYLHVHNTSTTNAQLTPITYFNRTYDTTGPLGTRSELIINCDFNITGTGIIGEIHLRMIANGSTDEFSDVLIIKPGSAPFDIPITLSLKTAQLTTYPGSLVNTKLSSKVTVTAGSLTLSDARFYVYETR